MHCLKKNWLVIVATLLLLLVFFLGYQVIQDRQAIKQVLHALEGQKVNLASQVNVPVQHIERVVANRELWRPIQEKVTDTVVQVFAQIAHIDLLQPYRAPNQQPVYGSAFFIDDEGHLLTNSHVVNQAMSIWITIPSLGKRIIDVELVGHSPERDVALLRLTEESKKIVEDELGQIPFLELGSSDHIFRSDEVMALGYPLGQHSLKSTTGVISGREHQFIQISAPINPGNSGGPLLNGKGQVIGINTAAITGAQNVGYIIPIDHVTNILADLKKVKVLRKPFLGIIYNQASDALTEYLGNPQPGGCYVVEVFKNSTLYKSGVQRGDMLYEINGHRLDIYGDMNVSWSEDKISISDYVTRMSVGENVNLIVYRKGERKDFTIEFSQAELPAIRTIFPGYEQIDYEIIAGMVVMPLTLNHIRLLHKVAPGLTHYVEMKNQSDPVLIVSHIFPNSEIYRSRSLPIGSILNELNGMKVSSLDDLRNAIKSSVGSKFLTFKITDNVLRSSENVLIVLPFDKVLAQEARLANEHRYPLSETVKVLLQANLDQTGNLKKPFA